MGTIARDLRERSGCVALRFARWAALSVSIASLLVPTAAATAQAGSAARDPARELLKTASRELDNPVFEEREAASKRLGELGGAAVPALSTAAKEGSLEAAVRAVALLESIYAESDKNNDVPTLEAAENVLEDLVRTARPSVADRADVVLEAHVATRERRAMAAIERLNGKLEFEAVTDLRAWNVPRTQFPLPADQPPDPARGELKIVIVGPKWKGGDEGLRHIARLKRLSMLYRIEGKQVSEAGITVLRSRMPGLDIQLRGAAKLGIARAETLQPEARGCEIDSVKEGEAAANAGLRGHDVIVKFAGHEIESFASLVSLLHGYNPGQTVEAIVIRDDKRLSIPLTLTGWD